MNKLIITVLSMLFIVKLGYSQTSQGGRFTAMARAGTAVKDVWGVEANPASIANIENLSAQLTYEQHFLMNELSTQAVAVVFPKKSISLGMNLQRYGISEYHTIKAGLVTSKQFGKHLSIGVRANYHQVKITNHPSATSFSIDVGAVYQVSNEVSMGVYINNPSEEKYKANYRIPTTLHFGIAYQTNSKVLIASTLIKELNKPINMAFGIDYRIIKLLSMRYGLSLKPFKHYFGFGFSSLNYLIDIAFTKYSHFNYSPQISIGYVF